MQLIAAFLHLEMAVRIARERLVRADPKFGVAESVAWRTPIWSFPKDFTAAVSTIRFSRFAARLAAMCFASSVHEGMSATVLCKSRPTSSLCLASELSHRFGSEDVGFEARRIMHFVAKHVAQDARCTHPAKEGWVVSVAFEFEP